MFNFLADFEMRALKFQDGINIVGFVFAISFRVSKCSTVSYVTSFIAG